MKWISLILLGLLATATVAFAQEPPQIDWEMDAEAANLAFSADGATMYTGGRNSNHYGNIKKWDVPSRTEIYTLTSGSFGVIGLTNALAVTPDGTAFASGHGKVVCPPEGPCEDVAIGFQVWNAASGTDQFALEEGDIDGLVESVAFSHDGEFVAFVMSRSIEDQIRVYNYPEYTLQGTYDGHGEGTYCAVFSPTDTLLATGGWDGSVRLWDVETHQLVRTLEHGTYTSGGYPISVAFSPDGSQLAVSGRGYALNATVWDVSSGDLVYSLPTGAGQYGTSSATIAFSPDGSYLVAGTMRYVSPAWGGLIRIWDLDDGSLAREYLEEPLGPVGSPMYVAVSPAADDWIAYTYDYQIKFAETGLDFGGLPVALTKVDCDINCNPTSGTLPFTPTFNVTIDNLNLGQMRQLAGRIDLTLGNGSWISNWRSGFTNIEAGGAFSSTFSQTLPAVSTLVGNNIFNLVVEDVTPSPFNQPPYLPSGDIAMSDCTVEGIAP